jgi:hypothetical protein
VVGYSPRPTPPLGHGHDDPDLLQRPTIHGGDEVLPSQSLEMLRTRKPYNGCNAGITHFHADPDGKASICKVGRDPQVDLIAEGADDKLNLVLSRPEDQSLRTPAGRPSGE